MAAAAVEKKLTVKKIREAVRKERERTKSNRRRKPSPSVLRALRACVRALRDESTGRLVFRRDDIASLTEDQQGVARGLAETLGKRVDELAKLLG